ncbi:MAG TPA: hypothetical protein VJ915_13680 [Balneolaceae bacterium]|nr:hypothetical protein [Balneolaceae bacterium]
MNRIQGLGEIEIGSSKKARQDVQSRDSMNSVKDRFRKDHALI